MPPKRQEKSSRQIILVFALIMAVFYTWTSMSTPYQMGHDQTYLGTFLAKDRDPTLYLRDYVFHDDTLYRSYIPAIRWLFDKLSRLTGSFDQALLSLVPVVVFFFTLGTGLLLLEWSQSVWIALVITFLAIPYRAAPSGELWGVGGVEFMLARTLATATGTLCFHPLFSIFGKAHSQGSGFYGCRPPACWPFSIPPPPCCWANYLPGFLSWLIFEPGAAGCFWPCCSAGYFLMAVYPLTFMEQQVPASAAQPWISPACVKSL